MNAEEEELLRYLLDQGWSPLEIAEELNLGFLRITNYMDKHNLGPRRFFIAVKVQKSRKCDEYWGPNVSP